MNPQSENSDQPPLTIYVANMAEDVWQLINSLPPDQKTEDIRGCDLTSDRELSAFLDTPRFVLISPVAVDPAFIAYMNSLVKKEFLQILTPRQLSGQISLDILSDEDILNTIVALSQTHQVSLQSYTASHQFIQLIDALQAKNPSIRAPLTPQKDHAAVVDFFGSKSGLRKFYDQNPQVCPYLQMSVGQIATNRAEAVGYAQSLFADGKGVVFKTTKGHSGIGVQIVKNSGQPVDFDSLLKEPYWDTFPIIVEEYAPIDISIGGGNPNAECLVDEQGAARILFYCGMRVDKHGSFQGIEIGPGAIPKEVELKLTALATCMGQQYAQRGYRGYFDIDCIATTSGQMLISESNVRRTGGTHVYHLAKALVGQDNFHRKYIVSNNYYRLPTKDYTTEKIISRLSSVLYNPETQVGFVLAGANTLSDGYLTYTIIANDKQMANHIENEMVTLLS